MTSAKPVLYIYGIFLFISWNLMLLLDQTHYTVEDKIQGVLFICTVIPILFTLVYIYYKHRIGKMIVAWALGGLFLINTVCFFVVP
jgi:hypothetical protein